MSHRVITRMPSARSVESVGWWMSVFTAVESILTVSIFSFCAYPMMWVCTLLPLFLPLWPWCFLGGLTLTGIVPSPDGRRYGRYGSPPGERQVLYTSVHGTAWERYTGLSVKDKAHKLRVGIKNLWYLLRLLHYRVSSYGVKQAQLGSEFLAYCGILIQGICLSYCDVSFTIASYSVEKWQGFIGLLWTILRGYGLRMDTS